MVNLVRTDFQLPPVDEKEVLRYAGVRGEADEGTLAILQECLQECATALSPKVCYRTLTWGEIEGAIAGAKESKGLKAALRGAKRVVLFAATVGIGVDRLIGKYVSLSPVKALFFQAIGAERIEALCEVFCAELSATCQGRVGKRFSAGYGDFPLSAQRDILRILEGNKIGVTLTDSLLMSPTKSVTALVGVDVEV